MHNILRRVTFQSLVMLPFKVQLFDLKMAYLKEAIETEEAN